MSFTFIELNTNSSTSIHRRVILFGNINRISTHAFIYANLYY